MQNTLIYEVKMGVCYTVCRWMRNTLERNKDRNDLSDKNGKVDDKFIKNP